MASSVAILLWALAALFLPIDGIPTISAVGSKFFTSEGDQWFIKGKPASISETSDADYRLRQALPTN